MWIKFPGIADGSTNIFITLEIPECCSECDDSMHNWHENVVTLYLKIGQENEYLRNCLSTKVSYVYLHPYCQRQIALHSFWVTTCPICSIWHSSPKCSGTLVGWSLHEFYRDECLYRTDKDSGRWPGYRPQRHELENHLKNWQQPMHSSWKLIYKHFPIALSIKTFEWRTAITPSIAQTRVNPYNWWPLDNISQSEMWSKWNSIPINCVSWKSTHLIIWSDNKC